MSTNATNPYESIAREKTTQRPTFVGVDGDGAAHYWSSYEQTVVVVESEDITATVQLEESPFISLGEWTEYTEEKRGWDVGPHVGGDLLELLMEALRQ